MPADRNRSLNTQGRQKSCSECAKTKRRCDLRQPRCLRCTNQNLPCIYPLQPATGNTTASQSDASISSTSIDGEMCLIEIPNTSLDESVRLLDFDYTSGLNPVDAVNAPPNGGLEKTNPGTLLYIPSGTQFSSSYLTPFALSRLEYAINILQAAPRVMVSQNCTPWSHPFLYEDHMPRSMQDACAACALHIAKNDTNATSVARHVAERADELAHSPPPTTPTEILARAHAMLLYQLIFVFSGDIRHYSQAEATIHQLELSSEALRAVAMQESDPSGPLLMYPSAAARAAWKSFIFRESARRTLLVLYHVISLCNLLRGRFNACHHEESVGTSVTFSAHLWNARSAFDFAVAWNSKSHFLVTELNTTELLQFARPDDIDEFGKVMLTGTMGIDDVRGWFHTRGGAF